ncbi:unnamed protein product [Cladocopium goreaui]|uniref:BTB domain-containing protein n=1 Tax=Cladocopium goreaui TaxID=2562237 RepID=A0A9P1G4F4_9DINO|nr:unnamed protein product [Cladocopium goreaui]
MPEPTRLVSSLEMKPTDLKVRLPKLTDSSGGPSLSENVRSFFQTCQFFDVCLVVKDVRFPVHQAVLASLSEGMQRFLREALAVLPRPEVMCCAVEELPSIQLGISHPKAVLVLLDFAYQLGGAFELDIEELRDVLKLAQIFELPMLQERLVEPMAQQVTHASIMEILAISVQFDLMGLYNHAFKILVLSGYLKEMAKSNSMLQYPELMQHMLLHFAATSHAK